jgi:phage-related minor tail protein
LGGARWRHRAGLPGAGGEVNLARTELEVELADTREAYRKALEHQLDAWRGRLDDLRVRAKLAQMEVRDEASELLDRVESAYHAARRHFDEATDDPGQTAEALRAGARAVLRDLRDSVAAARRKLA